MDAEAKSKWLVGLRSGEYFQGESALRKIQDGNKFFCCLGVLCDVLGTQWEKRPGDLTRHEHGALAGFSVKERDASYLSQRMLDYVGLEKIQQRELARRNDAGESFTQIADWIEANL